LSREMLLLHSEGIVDQCWYTLNDNQDPSNSEQAFGLTRFDGSRKPSGDAFVALSEKIANVVEVGLISNLPEGAWGVSYGAEGSAFWGTGEMCDQDLGQTPLWINTVNKE